MKVEDLKQILQDALDELENYEDADEVKMVGNTYFLHGASKFLGISGSNGGYISLSDIEVISEEEY